MYRSGGARASESCRVSSSRGPTEAGKNTENKWKGGKTLTNRTKARPRTAVIKYVPSAPNFTIKQAYAKERARRSNRSRTASVFSFLDSAHVIVLRSRFFHRRGHGGPGSHGRRLIKLCEWRIIMTIGMIRSERRAGGGK